MGRPIVTRLVTIQPAQRNSRLHHTIERVYTPANSSFASLLEAEYGADEGSGIQRFQRPAFLC